MYIEHYAGISSIPVIVEEKRDRGSSSNGASSSSIAMSSIFVEGTLAGVAAGCGFGCLGSEGWFPHLATVKTSSAELEIRMKRSCLIKDDDFWSHCLKRATLAESVRSTTSANGEHEQERVAHEDLSKHTKTRAILFGLSQLQLLNPLFSCTLRTTRSSCGFLLF